MERKLMRFHLFNCDHTYNLDPVEALLLKMEDKQKLKISVDKCYFRLQQMSEMCQTTIPKLQMDFAIFVVQAHESRLSINEYNAGIGYAKIYRALLQATGDKVLIVIGGDDCYKDADEEGQFVISRWARRKVASQFNEEYLDGKKSFIFSWNKQHREIHEEALLHYFDPSKKGQKFEHQPKSKSVPKITPQAAKSGDNQKEFVVIDVNETHLRRPIINDQEEQQKRESKIDLEESSYGAINSDTGSAPANYPEGTVLLDTRMHFGKITYKDEDVKIWDRRWQPSERAVKDLEREWKSIPVATVQFIANPVGGVTYHVSEVKSSYKEPVVDEYVNIFT